MDGIRDDPSDHSPIEQVRAGNRSGCVWSPWMVAVPGRVGPAQFWERKAPQKVTDSPAHDMVHQQLN